MGRTARLGVVCLMALALGLARLVEVELDPAAPPLSVAAPTTPPPVEESPAPSSPGVPAAPAATTTPGADAEWPQGRVYVVKPGETLGVISKKVYGTTRFWKRLQEANREVIPDPGRMRAGARLRLPEVDPR